MTQPFKCRPARSSDAGVIAAIYNEGIDDRIATFETRPRTAADIRKWLDTPFPIVVVAAGRRVVGFASTSSYRDRECYRGIAEFSVYVARAVRGRGAGRVALAGLITAAERAGFWKLVSRIFVENEQSRRLMSRLGFREVGIYRRHGQLDGQWRDVVIVERLLGDHHPAHAEPPSVDGFSNQVASLARFFQLRDRERVCRYGLTVSECYALEAIAERPAGIGINELAAALSLNKSSASRVADRLVTAGLARHGAAPDRRSRRIVVTRRGDARHSKIKNDILTEHRTTLSSFDAQSLQHGTRALEALARARVTKR